MSTLVSSFVVTEMTKRKSNNIHLKLRGNVWWYQRRVPKALKKFYPDTTTISRSLDTSDVHIARKLRDKINGELAHSALTRTDDDNKRFRELVREMRAEKEVNRDWDAWIYPERLIERGDELTLKAYMTVNGKENYERYYAFTVREALAEWLNRHGVNKSKETQRKVEQSVNLFLEFMDAVDMPISDITRRHAYEFLATIEKNNSRATCQAHMSRLKTLWKNTRDLGEVTGDNPFEGHSYTSPISNNRKQMFEPQELRKIMELIKNESRERQLYVQLALFTGCRLSELGNLTKRHLMERGSVPYIFIEQGKTSSATRNVPIPLDIAHELKLIAEQLDDDSPLLGIEGKTFGRWFSVLKTNHITKDSTKSFHSFRGMFITALKRCDIPETITAEIVGHKRGSTMSYGYYAKDNEVQKLSESASKAVNYIRSEWLQCQA